VKPLQGGDVFHLRRDGAGHVAHTVKIAVLEPGEGPLDPDDVAHWAGEALPARDPFCWRLRAVPLRLGRPVWVRAEPLEVAWHVRRRTLGDGEGLDEVVAELAGGPPLPRDRPLWRLWVVDGLEGGRVALVLQLHHALADGAASVRLWEELFDEALPATIGPDASARDRLGATVRQWGRSARRLPRMLVRLGASDRRRRTQVEGLPPVTDYFESPPTPFNEPPSAHRCCTFVRLPFADVHATAKRLDGTVNDVYAALCGGALRAYLLERDELPELPLTASSPAGLPREDGPYGNAVTSWFWNLATDEPDPRARFERIRASLAAARHLQEQDPRLLFDFLDHAVLYEAAWRAMDLRERRKGSPMFNAIVSNVRGPDPLTWQGHPVVALQSVGPLAGRMALNFTAWSYDGALTVGIHACRRAVPDIGRLGALLADELTVLTAATREPTSR